MDVNLFSTVEEKILGIFTQSQHLSSLLVMPRLDAKTTADRR